MSSRMVETEAPIPQSSLRDVYYVLFRHKWKIIVFFLVVMFITTIGILSGTEHYLSQAKLLVRLGRENVTLDPTATTGTIIPVRPSLESEMNTELEILKSQEIAAMTVDALGAEVLLYKERPVNSATGRMIALIKKPVQTGARRIAGLFKPPSETAETSGNRSSAILTVMNNLQIQTKQDSSTVGLAYKSQNPELAQEVLTALIASYLEKHIAVHQTPGSHKFFTEQSGHLQQTLSKLESELRDLRNEAGIASLQEQKRVILDHVSNLDRDISAADVALAASTAKAEALQKTLSETPETVVTRVTDGFPNVAADGMRQRLYDLQLQEQDLLSKYDPQSRHVEDIRRQIAAAEALLGAEKPQRTQETKELSRTYVDLQSLLLAEQANASSLRAQTEALKAKLADAQAELAKLNDVEVRSNALGREIAIQEANYRKYSENLEQARIDDALENEKISNISVLQAATLPVEPIGSGKKITLLLGLAMGILGGIGLAFTCEYTDHSIKTPRQAEDRLGLSTLSCIPYIPTFSISREASIKGYHEALGILEEQILMGFGDSRKVRVLAITGSHRHEGVSAVAANLATSLAGLGLGDVLLIDANLSHPSVHETFGTRLSPGLAETLRNQSENGHAINSSQVHNLHILSAGKAKQNFSEILSSGEFRKLLNAMKKSYRFILLDLPAVNEASWTIRLAGLCDGVCLVVEAERSRWEVVDRAKRQLLKSNANLLGVVLNKRKLYIPEWLYRTL